MRVVAIILLGVLLRDQLPAQKVENSPIKQQVAALPPASLVEVVMNDGDKLRGHIATVGGTEFALAREKRGGTQSIAYDQVRSVSQVKHSNKKWIIIGVVVAAIAVVGIIIGVAASKPPLGNFHL